MKIVYCEPPFNKEFTMFSNPEDFLKEIKEKGYVYVDASFETKTRVYTSLYLPGFSFSINEEVNGIKTHGHTGFSYISGGKTQNNYFKILKSQKIEKYEEYISAIISRIIKDDNIEIRIYETDVIKELRS